MYTKQIISIQIYIPFLLGWLSALRIGRVLVCLLFMLVFGAWLFQLFLCFLQFRVWMRLTTVYFRLNYIRVFWYTYIRRKWWFFVNLNRGINQNITFIELMNSFSHSTRLKRYTFPVCVNMAYCILQTTNVQVVHLFSGSFKKSKPFFSAVQFCHVLYNFHSKNMYGIQCVQCAVCIVYS